MAQIIDLSLSLNNSTPIYPGDPKVEIKTELGFWNQSIASISVHAGTHVDAPFHKLQNGKKLCEFQLENFYLKAAKVVIEKDTGEISKEELMFFAKDIERAEAIIIQTGYGKKMLEGKIGKDFPALSEKAAGFLAGFSNLKLVGIDAPSIDCYKKSCAHEQLLGKNILALESLVNLENAPRKFLLACFPIKFERDAAPCRAVAIVEQQNKLNKNPFFELKEALNHLRQNALLPAVPITQLPSQIVELLSFVPEPHKPQAIKTGKNNK